MKPIKLPAVLLTFVSPLLAGLPGPELVKDIYPGAKASMDYGDPFGAIGNTLFFGANDSSKGKELWKSDGTPGGTVMVKDLCAGSHGGGPRQYVTAGSYVFFSGHDLTHGYELWRSDGTTAGTIMLKDIVPGGEEAGSSFPRPLGAAGSNVYFAANTEKTNGGDLWKSDGTPAGTVKVTTIYPAERVTLAEGVALGGVYYFYVGRSSAPELWRTDSTQAGTYFVSKFDQPAVAAGNRLFFRSSDGTHGKELWSSDGSPGGAAMVKDIAPGSTDGLASYTLMAAGNLVYFPAQSGSDPATLALWRSDGTEAGTFPLMALAEPLSGKFHTMGGQIYFAPKVPGGSSGIWKSDGTVAGTVPLKTGIPSTWQSGFIAHDDKSFYFYSAINDLLWQSDGTTQGTRAVADLYLGSTSTGGTNVSPRSINGKLLFGVYSPNTGKELYSYDTRLPSIAPAVVSERTTTGLRIEVGINPSGLLSTATFEYGPTESYGTMKRISLAGAELISRFQDFPLELSGLSAGTLYHFRITASNSAGTRTSTGTFRTAFTRPSWRTTSFGATASTLVSGDTQDPDGDGLNNLIEYAFGLDPNRGDVAGLPQPVSDNGNLIFEYTHPEGQDDMIYGVEWSTSMAPGSWTAVPDTGGGNHHRFVVEKQAPRVFTRWTVNPR